MRNKTRVGDGPEGELGPAHKTIVRPSPSLHNTTYPKPFRINLSVTECARHGSLKMGGHHDQQV